MNKKADYGFKILKRCISKTEKMRKCPKQPILGMFLCIRVTKSVLPEFCCSCKVLFCSFLQMKMFGKLKSCGIAWNQVFCVKNAVFSPNHKHAWGNLPLIKH